MQVAVRSCLTAGVAAVSAAALIAAPVMPTPTEIKVPAIYSAQVNLTAASNPITPWLDVLDQAVGNVVGIGGAVAADPLPGVRQLVTNLLGHGETLVTGLTGAGRGLFTYATETVPTALRTAGEQLRQGNVTGAAKTISDMTLGVVLVGFSLIDVVAIPGQMADTAARVVNAVAGFGTLLPLVIGAVGPISAVINTIGAQGQALVDAFADRDLLGAISALVNTPAALTGALLNGFGDAPGLLTFDSATGNNGLLTTLFVTIPRVIADALKPPAPATVQKTAEDTVEAGVSALPDANAVTITLDATTEAAVEAPETVAEQVAEEVAAEVAAPVETVAEEGVAEEAAPAEVVEELAAEELEEAEEPVAETKDVKRVAPRTARTGVKRAGNPAAA